MRAINAAKQDLEIPEGIQTRFQGAAQAFESSLSSTLLLILAAVVTMYIVLGFLRELYPSGDHSFDTATCSIALDIFTIISAPSENRRCLITGSYRKFMGCFCNFLRY